MKVPPIAGLLSIAVTLSAVAAPPFPGRKFAPEIIEAKFKEFDKDADGQLKGAELSAQPFLALLDGNADGAVTLEEAKSVLATLATARRGAAPAPEAPSAPPAAAAEESPRQGPAILKASESGIGQRLADLKFADLGGTERDLWSLAGKNGLIVALVGPDCPVSKRYLPTIAALEKDVVTKGFGLALLSPLTESAAALKTALSAAGISAPAAIDPKGALAKALGARVSTEVFVYDGARTLVYRGAIDDQYGLGYQLDAPRERYLQAALESVSSGTRPRIQATEAPGCVLDLTSAPAVASAEVTYHNRISRIVQANCQECHRDGGVAPFPLETHDQVAAKSGMIKRMVSRNLMPPWFAAADAGSTHSPWINDRSLSQSDKADLLTWLDGGKIVGDVKDAPLPRVFPSDWEIGKPDMVAQIPNPIEIKATGTMKYQYANIDLGLTEDKWVRGFEVQPTAREVVHHVLIFVQEKGKPLRQDGQFGGFFAAWVPGSNWVIYPDGFAKPLPAGSRLIFQIHYTPNGTATRDQVRIGLLFAKEPPKHEVRVVGISARRLNIPPGADNHPESATIPVPRPVRLIGLMPHMHVRGKSFKYEVTLPDGSEKTLLEVPRYDFNWQLAYRYADHLALPAGSRVKATGWFDNSANNPANPDPTQTVRFGEQTSDEMMIGYVEYYFSDEDLRTSAK